MLISIYKKTEEGFQQQFIENGESVPTGWTDDINKLDLEKPEPTELELLKQELEKTKTENAELKMRQEISEEAILTLSDMMLAAETNKGGE